jgi:hypothetical protein
MNGELLQGDNSAKGETKQGLIVLRSLFSLTFQTERHQKQRAVLEPKQRSSFIRYMMSSLFISGPRKSSPFVEKMHSNA